MLNAPFPWFGGKRTIAADVWHRFGAVDNYVEPFFGSGAMLLSRPHAPKLETINDKDRFVANFWRAVQHDPEAVAALMDWPVNEVDLGARHQWLLGEGARRLEHCDGDPDFYDAKVAAWWCWGACSWIGGGWCSGEGPWSCVDGEWAKRGDEGVKRQLPHLGDAGRGINRKLPHLGDRAREGGDAGRGINRKLPHLGDAGRGINRKLPHLGDAWMGVHKSDALLAWITALADRLRRVRVCCGDWARITGPSVTWRHGTTGVFLDPPYSDAAGRDADLYATDSLTVAHEAREWAIAEGANPLMRIAFCGYEGEHVFPDTWSIERWKAHGGFGSQGDGVGRANAERECIWYSPACLPKRQPDLFSALFEQQPMAAE